MLLRACTSYRTAPHSFLILLSSMCPTTQQPCVGVSAPNVQGLAGSLGCAPQPSFHRGTCSHSIPPLPQAAAAALHTGPPTSPSWSFNCSHSQQQQELQQLQPQLLRAKSAKRKAAEALLAARYAAAAAAEAPSQLGAPHSLGRRSTSSSPPPHASKTVCGSHTQSAAVAAAAAAAAQQHPAPKGLLTCLSQAAGQQAALQPHPKRLCSSLAASSGTAEAASSAVAGSRLWGAVPSNQQGTQEASSAAAAVGPDAGTGANGSSSSSSSSAVGSNIVKGNHRGGGAALVAVPACPPACSHPFANAWCHFQVQVPHVDWHQVTSGSPAGMAGFRIADGYEQLTLPGGLQVLLVENAAYVAPAMQALRASMTDSLISIDLEWRPEFNGNFTPVALLQLASSRMAVLIRTCRMGFQLHPAVKSFLQDPGVSLLGCGWGGADEQKMQRTFSLSEKQLGGVLDIQQIARGMGYTQLGLANLCRAVLGVSLPKSKRVSMSNWETRALSRIQVQYAALDVFLAGQVFRGLRLWHTCQEPCATCLQLLGAVLLGQPSSPDSSSANGSADPSSSNAGEAAAPHQGALVAATESLGAAAAAAAAAAGAGRPSSTGKPHTCPACGRRVMEAPSQRQTPSLPHQQPAS